MRNNYTLTGIESALGGPHNDWLKATSGSLLEGGPGADYLDAKAGRVTLSYASSTAGVSVQIQSDAVVSSGGDAEGDVIGYDGRTDVSALIGSAQDDTLGAEQAFEDIFTLTGGGGNDTFQMLGVTGGSDIDLCVITDFDQTEGETDLIDLRPIGITSMANIDVTEFSVLVSSSPNGPPVLGIELRNFGGTISAADFLFATAVSGFAVADPGGAGLVGGRGADLLLGRAGDDFLFGKGGDDVLRGRGGNDALHGGIGDDRMNGANGRDLVRGGRGEDGLRGGDGDDLLDGGAGADWMRGGHGADTLLLRFGELDGDVIADFARAAGDRLTVVAAAGVTLVDLGRGVFHLTDGSHGETLTVRGATAADFLL